MEQRQHRRQVAPSFAPRVLATEWAAIIFAFWIGAQGFPYWPLATIILGRGQWTLMDNVGHWAAHFTLFRKKERNRLLEWLYFLPVFTGFAEWSAEHFQHHSRLGTEKDPERDTFVRWKLMKEDGTPDKPYAWCMLRVPLHDFRKNLLQLRVWRNFKLCMFWISVLLMTAATHAWTLLGQWMLAHFFAKPYFMFLSETFEHWKAPAKEGKLAYYGSRMLAGSFFALFKPYGDQWHALHHERPSIPPDQLEELAAADARSGNPHYPSTFKYFLHQVNNAT